MSCRCVPARASGEHVVGAALHWHPVSLPHRLPAAPWPGKTEPSRGARVVLHYAACMFSSIGRVNKIAANCGNPKAEQVYLHSKIKTDL